jgi:hypothetical protein
MKNKIKKYVTIEEGVDFRTIAKIMTDRGYKMNHATARNVLISAIRRIMTSAADQVGTRIPENQMDRLVKDQDLHMALADVLYQAHQNGKANFNNEGNDDGN